MDPNQTSLTYGAAKITGFDPAMITIEKVSKEEWFLGTGVDGARHKVKNHDKHARATLNLAAGSLDNNQLDREREKAELTGQAGLGFEWFNPFSGERCVMVDAVIMQAPDTTPRAGQAQDARVWIIEGWYTEWKRAGIIA